MVYALDEAADVPRSLLRLRRLVVLNTGDTDLDREAETFGDSLELIWRRCVGTYLGDVAVRRMLAGPMAASTVEQRATWLDDARRLTAGG